MPMVEPKKSTIRRPGPSGRGRRSSLQSAQAATRARSGYAARSSRIEARTDSREMSTATSAATSSRRSRSACTLAQLPLPKPRTTRSARPSGHSVKRADRPRSAARVRPVGVGLPDRRAGHHDPLVAMALARLGVVGVEQVGVAPPPADRGARPGTVARHHREPTVPSRARCLRCSANRSTSGTVPWQ